VTTGAGLQAPGEVESADERSANASGGISVRRSRNLIQRFGAACRKVREPVWVGAVLALTVLTRLPTLSEPLVEMHGFRQTQTAWSAVLFARQGIDLLHPQVPVLGLPFALPLELPLFQAMAAPLLRLGLPVEPVLRGLDLLWFSVSALLIYLIGRRLAGRQTALIALIAFTFSPFAILWSRTALIEYLAVAAGLAVLYFTMLALDRHSWRWTAAAAIAGAIALTVKDTTGAVWGVVTGTYVLSRLLRTHSRREIVGRALIIGLPALAAAIVWMVASAAVRRENLYAYTINDAGFGPWFFGTPAQRLDPSTWLVIAIRIVEELTGFAALVWLYLAVREIRHQTWSYRLPWLGLIGVIALAPLVLTNVYLVHDYYLAAISPAIALVVGLGGAHLLARWRAGRAIGLVLVAAWAMAFWSLGDYVALPYSLQTNSGELRIARQIEAETSPDRMVALITHDNFWDPSYFFYAHREGLLVVDEILPLGALQTACSDPRYQVLELVDGTVRPYQCP
jgi:hypothetical protein